MNKLKYHFLGGLVFLGTIIFGYIGFAAYTNLVNQVDGATITKDIWNDVINTVNNIGAKTDSLETKTSNIYQSGENIRINGNIYSSGGALYSSITRNEGGAIALENPLKIADNIAKTWVIYNMNSIYGSNSLQFFNYDTRPCGVGMCQSRVTFTDDGKVGIGTNTPSYTLHVIGSVAGTSAFVNTSDIRYKKNISSIDNSLEKINQLNGVYFDWKTDEYKNMNFKKTKDIGVIAQNVEKVFPEAISTDKDGYKSVAYGSLVAPIINAIKELYNKYLDQDKIINEQNKKIEDLENRLEKLENK